MSLRTEGFKPSASNQFRHAPVHRIVSGHRRPLQGDGAEAVTREMEAAGGFEPPHRGFAVRSLNHLGTPPCDKRKDQV